MSTYHLKRPFFPGVLCMILCLTLSCKNEQSTITDANTSDTTAVDDPATIADEPEKTNSKSDIKVEVKTKDLVYAWVDKLNIRNSPSLNGTAITTVQSEDALEFTGEKSKQKETIVLRGVAYDEPWLKIITPDGKKGWVFGGAVKLKGEKKGNAPITDLKFDYPHFGSFDLTKWKKLDSKDHSGGDATINTTKYSNNNQIIEFSKYDTGEYTSGNTYSLYDNNQKLLKKRDLDREHGEREIKETVSDFTVTPPKKYMRSQKISKSFYELNDSPMMVNGKWEESNLDENN